MTAGHVSHTLFRVDNVDRAVRTATRKLVSQYAHVLDLENKLRSAQDRINAQLDVLRSLDIAPDSVEHIRRAAEQAAIEQRGGPD